MFNFLKFFKNIKSKKGQSMVEYAIIIGVVVVVGFSAASGLYDAARHNFYYGLLPTNSQNISLPDGPNGEKGWFNEDYMGIPKINCSASLIPQPTPIEDDDGRTVLVYGVDPEQEIYCQDVSINSVRNNWGSQYKSIMLGTEEEKKLSITIWDHFGMTHSTYVLLRPYVNSETGAEEDKPVARITTQPDTESKVFLETDDIAIFGTTSSPLPGGQIDAYEWEIVDIGYVNNKKQTESYKVHPHGNNYTNLIKTDPDYKSFNVQIVSDDVRNIASRKTFNQNSYTNLYLGANPKGTRYIRLRVHSTGSVNGVSCTPTTCWSDWTQKPIKTGESERPRAVITAYKAENFEYNPNWNDSIMRVRENDQIFLTYTDSINPTTSSIKVNITLENGEIVETNKGLISYKWHLSKLNLDTNEFEDANPETALQEIDSINTLNTQYTEHVEDKNLGIYGFRFKEGEIGTYCVRLSVRNEDGTWSYLGECESDFSVPDSPHHKSTKYIIVRERNIPPEFGPNSTSNPVMENKIIKAKNDEQIKINIDVVHPEIEENPTDYMHKFEESDYTFGEYDWKLVNDAGVTIYESDDFAASNSEILTLPIINTVGTYTLKVRVKDATGMWDEPGEGIDYSPNAIFTIIIDEPLRDPIHFPYTGEIDCRTLPAGKYKLEVWGAQGGKSNHGDAGGKGGYASGIYEINTPTTVCVGVGGEGTSSVGGFNGGGDGSTTNNDSAGGGGATHIALANGELYTLENNKAAVIIVAGGGGASGCSNTTGGAGGGETGQTAQGTSYGGAATGGTQTTGGIGGLSDDSTRQNGYFGHGGNTKTVYAWPGAGGGGGWYGGGAGGNQHGGGGTAGGGSGYVNTTLLTSTSNINGINSFPNITGTGNETGHTDDGYAIITPLEDHTSTYQVFETGLSWTAANTYCANSGGHLAVVTSAEEELLIENAIQSTSFTKAIYWLGGSNVTTSSWTWTTGETTSYSNWAPGEPTGNQGYIGILTSKAPTLIPESSSSLIWKWLDNPNEGIGNWSLANTGFICEYQ